MTAHSKIESRTGPWTPQLVRQHLTQAYRVLWASTGQIGHKRIKAAWPDYLYSTADLAEQLQSEVQANKRGETTLSKRRRSILKPSSHDIANMEAILINPGAWLAGVVRAYPEHCDALIASSKANARGESDRSLCRRMGWDRMDFRRKRDFAAKIIAADLNNRGFVIL